MSRVNLEDMRARNVSMHKFRMERGILTLSGAYVLTDGEPDILAVDPGGASRNFDMPAIGDENRGRIWIIINTADAAENLTVRQPGGGATIVTISQNEIGIITNVGSTYYGGMLPQT